MKTNLSILFIIILLFLSQQAFCQGEVVSDSDIKIAAKGIIDSATTCA